jgi:spore germination cell wall hydrolase CwlJ-like protein
LLIKNFVTIALLSLTAFTFTPGVAHSAKAANVKSAKVVHKCTKRDTKQNLLACAIYAESRGQGKKGMSAVGNVVLNRVNNPQFPKTVKGVLFQPSQFSYTYKGNFKVTEKDSWQEAKHIADKLIYLNTNFPEVRDAIDPTKGALYFKKKTIRTHWEKDMTLVYRYKEHQFYR